MSIKHVYDVVVIGGGPAGMMSAGRLAERGFDVLLIEKNEVLGKKLSTTGGGRCNITNAEFDTRTLLAHYGEAEPFLHSAFAQFGVQSTFDFFTAHNLPLVVQERKRAFPKTEKAVDVTRVMTRYLAKHNVTVLTGTAVRGFETREGVVSGIVTDGGVYRAHAYVVASGGKSHAETGSTGEGISWLGSLGHKTHASNPNLVPLVVRESWVRALSGTTLSSVRITFAQGSEKFSKDGNVLVTHFGLSGPMILNSAHRVKTMLQQGVATAFIDLFPKDDVGAVRAKFQKLCEENGNKSLHNALKEWFPRGVVEAILVSFPQDTGTLKVHGLARELRHAIVDRMKAISLTVTGTMGYDWAIVSDGGVDLKEVDTRTMQSKLHPNVYVVGDVLHINRPSGGYSLQLCWTTGWVAGNSIPLSKK